MAEAIPAVAVSTTTTRVNLTGSWKYIRPVWRDRVAPCNAACPVGVDIEGYMNLLREGRDSEAIDLLLRENPLPAITGRVCDHPCETACNRCSLDEGVAVHAVERALGDAALARTQGEARARRNADRIAVIGSGPAGLSAAVFLTRLGYAVTILEAAPEPGGLLRLGIPPYRLPRDVLDRQIAQIRAEGVSILCNVRMGRDLAWDTLDWFDAVFVATGAHRSRPLDVQGEELPGVHAGLEYLRRANDGHAPDLGKQVVVVGGGNTAMDCARSARRQGADVLVLYRRTREEMPAIADEITEAAAEGVRFLFLAAPIEVMEQQGRLCGVAAQRMVLGSPDASGRRRPVPSDEAPFSITADAVITAIGEEVDGAHLPFALEGGAVPVDVLGRTAAPHFFAGGDMAGHERTVAHAIGAGKRAAIGIDRHLRARRGESPPPDDVAALRWGGAGNLSMSRWRQDDPVPRIDPVNEVVEWADINAAHFAPAPRLLDWIVPPGRGRSGMREVNRGLSRSEATSEAKRCLNCGVCNDCQVCMIFCPDAAITPDPSGHGFVVDLDYCKGCGLCAAECPRGAVTMTREGL
ncbi:MAG: NAD(P)-binding protein [Gemmatimonadota bacterium]